MYHLFGDFFSFLMPKRCFYCKSQLLGNEMHLCFSCEFILPKHHNNTAIEQLFNPSIKISSAAAFLKFEKTGITQQVIHHIKYHSNKSLATYMGRLFADHIKNNMYLDADYFIPVPLHPKKLKERGFNQSALFAEGLASELDVLLDTNSLQRIRYTESQTHKNKEARKENVKNCFKLSNEANFAQKHLVLLDDVITTGATLEACIDTLKNIEGIKISVLCMAMA